MLEVLEVPEWGDSLEHYFAWNNGGKSKSIKSYPQTSAGTEL